MQITPYGAAETVTGSCHLVEVEGYKLLLDCGAYQGSEDERNSEPFGFEASQVDAVLLSHAHNDHIGRLPQLVRHGFSGKVFATLPTVKIIPIILEDSLHLQTEERERAIRKGKIPAPLDWEEQDLKELYTRLNVIAVDADIPFGPLTAHLRTAGHLPGSVFIEVTGDGKKIVFSGDLGHKHKEVLPQAPLPPAADLVLCESTYGDRPHRTFGDTYEEFREVLQTVLGRGGKVYIPGFAVERTQEILFYIRQLEDQKEIPIVPIFVDSPMAGKVSNIYDDFPEFFSEEVQSMFADGRNPFEPAMLKYTANVDESKAINDMDGPLIVIAGNGMLSGGRILHHLRNGLPDPKNALIITGYQPRGGIGQLLIDGASEIRVFGSTVPVKADSFTLGGFSGHAGQDELLEWLSPERNIYLVHGEIDKMQKLQVKLAEQGKTAHIAKWGESISV